MIGTYTLSNMFPFMPARLIGDDVTFGSVSTDTRTVESGDLFIAISGERFDGNTFVRHAAEKLAAAAIVSKVQDTNIAQLLVADPVQALGWLGHMNRSRSSATVVAITGSQGKTTVKELTGAILSQQFRTLVTRGNLNNSIGAPRMLLEIDAEHERVVIELGANAQGEIAWGTHITDPHIVLLNNAAETHVEGFGGLEGVVKGKGEILDSAESTHTVILNADDSHVNVWLRRAASRRCVQFSGSGRMSADYRAANVQILQDGCQFELITPQGTAPCFLPLPGAHNISNAIAAAALSMEAGATLLAVTDALSSVRAVDGRLKSMRGRGGSRLIDDTYNASPSSFRAAVDVLCQIAQSQSIKSVLIAGDMAELGDIAQTAHRELGEYAKSSGVDVLWTVGELSEGSAKAFGAAARHFSSKDELAAYAGSVLSPDHVVLVKGSRSAGMEEIVSKIKSGESD
ncbi:MAG: UDP-N-acetylmuramoyl-tripeptide--D-alanyl-D-alanine ligase [Pseudohongiella sp.]|nr:UDP-N-acetylmuramoyl-tripeptide--D-alanyl-D-alanine ligase [Pseudohongiella sp.]